MALRNWRWQVGLVFFDALRNGIDQKLPVLKMVSPSLPQRVQLHLYRVIWYCLGNLSRTVQIDFPVKVRSTKWLAPLAGFNMTALGWPWPFRLYWLITLCQKKSLMDAADAFAHDLFTIVTVGSKVGDDVKVSTADNRETSFAPTTSTAPALEGRQ